MRGSQECNAPIVLLQMLGYYGHVCVCVCVCVCVVALADGGLFVMHIFGTIGSIPRGH